MSEQSEPLASVLRDRRELFAALANVDAAVGWLELRIGIAPDSAPTLIHFVLDALIAMRGDMLQAVRRVPLEWLRSCELPVQCVGYAVVDGLGSRSVKRPGVATVS